MKKENMENRIINAVRKLGYPARPKDLVKEVSKTPNQADSARDAIRSLVDKGDLTVTIDWKLRKNPE